MLKKCTYEVRSQKNFILSYESMTPLGSPVVPLEVKITITSSPLLRCGFSIGLPWRRELYFTMGIEGLDGTSSNTTTWLIPFNLESELEIFLKVKAEQNTKQGLLMPSTCTISSEKGFSH